MTSVILLLPLYRYEALLFASPLSSYPMILSEFRSCFGNIDPRHIPSRMEWFREGALPCFRHAVYIVRRMNFRHAVYIVRRIKCLKSEETSQVRSLTKSSCPITVAGIRHTLGSPIPWQTSPPGLKLDLRLELTPGLKPWWGWALQLWTRPHYCG